MALEIEKSLDSMPRDAAQAEEVVEEEEKEDPFAIDEWPLFYDLRPRGEVGFPEGAAARELTRVNRLKELGVLAEGVIEGFKPLEVETNGKMVEITVFACQPISMQEMVPHGEFTDDQMVSPLWRSDKPLWLLRAQDMRPKEEPRK